MKALFRFIFLFTIIFCISTTAQSQFRSDFDQSDIYLELSSGIDNHVGLFGLGILYPINQKVAIRGGAGIGIWGLKTSLGVKFQNLETQKWGFGIGTSYCPGVKEFEMNLSDDPAYEEIFYIKMKPAGSLNLTANRSWKFSSNMIFYMETGYAIPLSSSKPVDFKDPDGYLTSQDEADLQALMNVLKPGGLILALGFQIGF